MNTTHPTLRAGLACMASVRAGLWSGRFAALVLCVGAPVLAQTLIYGPAARSEFDYNVATYGDKKIDFNSLAVGPLSTQLQATYGVTFASTIQTDGSPIVPPHNAYVSSQTVNGILTNKLIGTPYALSGADDGRVGYQITFTSPQARAGLDRLWQAGNSLTRFYNSSGTLLGTHFNTVGSEFVAYVADYNNPLTWVARIEMDGLAPAGTRQVGYSDNLIYGFTAIPEPSIAVLIAAGLGLLACTRLRARHRDCT